ncbi:integrase catalytic domain-containing protein [Trichonephila clavipes]|nr:integrase catalytic domain-containing protein [Trichonephila clavipes]
MGKSKKITQHIYKLWKRDYLNNLQERHKWKFNKNNVSVGTLVLIKDENLPSTKWSTGRITEIFPGTDDSPLVSMKKEKRDVPLRTAYSQAGRLWQPKPSSLRAQAQLSETQTETIRL